VGCEGGGGVLEAGWVGCGGGGEFSFVLSLSSDGTGGHLSLF
jgi:hypothetical protein